MKNKLELWTIDELMSMICTIAILKYDGHFSILSFTTHYKGGFNTYTKKDDISELPTYSSLKELLIEMIKPEIKC
jgi:hypothetical protein